MTKLLLAAVVVLGITLIRPGQAAAGGFHFSLGLPGIAVFAGAPYAYPPAVVYPPPAYYPAPVYAPPVYVAPPVYSYPYFRRGWGHGHYKHYYRRGYWR